MTDQAPLGPAGIPVPDDGASNLSMSFDGNAPGEDAAPRLPLTTTALRLHDHRLFQKGAVSEAGVTTGASSRQTASAPWQVVSPSARQPPASLPIAAGGSSSQDVSPSAQSLFQPTSSTMNSLTIGDQRILQNQANISNVFVQNDRSPLLEQIAEHRHNQIIGQIANNFQEQLQAMGMNVMSGVSQLRVELAQAETRLGSEETQARQRLATGQSQLDSQANEINVARGEAQALAQRLCAAESHADATYARLRDQLHQAEAKAVSNADLLNAEMDSARVAAAQATHAVQATSEVEISRLTAEVRDFRVMMSHESEKRKMAEKENAELKSQLNQAIAALQAHASATGSAPSAPPGLIPTYPINTPPQDAKGSRPRRHTDGGGPDGDDDGSDDDDSSSSHRKKKSKKKDKKSKKRDSSSSSDLSPKQLKAIIKQLAKGKTNEKEEVDEDVNKTKSKEAEKILFPKFPTPEQYRNWRIRVREAVVTVVAASNKPDEAFEWLSKVWDKDSKEEELRDTGGFSTLDAKVLLAVTNVLEGDFARQMDTLKEREAHAGRLVRGRQILFLLHQHFATNILRNSVYDMEDLLSVTLVNENLVMFVRNWDTVLSGIQTTPEDKVLEPLFHRQVKKCKALQHDIAIYERAAEGSSERSFKFLYDAANSHLNRKRLERNRERIAKQTGAPAVGEVLLDPTPRQESLECASSTNKVVATVERADAFTLRKDESYWYDKKWSVDYTPKPDNQSTRDALMVQLSSESPPIEWIGDTGSAQDLISERELVNLRPYESDCPINICTANGPSDKVFLDVKDNVPYLKSWKEGIACPAHARHESTRNDTDNVVETITNPEQVAAQLIQEQDFSHQACLRLLKDSNFKQSRFNRKAIKPKDSKDSKYMIFGAFSHGGMQGITNRTHSYPKVIKYLLSYLKHHGADGPITSIAVNQNSGVKMHKDVNNHREHLNYTIAIGDFTGGELWIHDDTIRKDEPGCINKIAPTGAKLGGRLRRSKSKVISFDPKTFHCVTPWKGERWSITGYVNRAVHRLDSHQLEKLKSLGFLLPKQKDFPPAVPAEIDEEMTLYELATMDPPAPAPEPKSKPKVKLKKKPEEPSDKKKIAKEASKAEPPSDEPDWSKVEGLLKEAVAPIPSSPDEEFLDEAELVRSPKPDSGEPSVLPPPPEGERHAPDGDPGEGSGGEGKRSRRIENLKKEAKSAAHLMTHLPKNPFCDVCQRAKMYKPPSYQTDGWHSVEAKAFGDHITADHIIVYRDRDTVIEESRLALVLKDVATSFTYAYPSALRSEDECIAALQHFVSSSDEIGVFYSDQAKELISAAKFLGMNVCNKVSRPTLLSAQQRSHSTIRTLSSPLNRPSAVANPVKDEWTIRGDKLIRFHYSPRRELFSPDLTDCPVPISALGKERLTKIMPIGGTDIIADCDEWRHVRKRNKKLSFKWVGRTEFDILTKPHTSEEAVKDFPCMPTVPMSNHQHRDKIPVSRALTAEQVQEAMAMVARPVGRKELLADPQAQASLDVEWEKLMKKKAWDMSSVREWEDVSKEAAKRGSEAAPDELWDTGGAKHKRDQLWNSPEVESLIYSMKWGYHLDQLIDEALKHLNEARDHHPEGAATHIIFGWSGNDVWGQHGYHGYTWHLQSKFTKRTAEELEQIDTWPAKQKLRCTIIDPVELYEQTSRPDGFHADASDQNLQSTLRWHAAMLRGILTDYRLLAVEQQLIANQKEAVFHAHFVLNKPEPFLTVPPASGRILSKIVDSPDPPLAREAEEEIVLAGPLLAEAEYEVVNDDSAQSCNPQPITEFDFARNDTRPGAGCVLAIEDSDPINVVAEEHLVMANQAAEGITQEELTAVAAEEEITLLSQFVEQDDDPYENADTYSLKKAEVVAPPSPVVVISDPDAPQPSEAVAQAPLVPKAKPRPPTLPRWVTADQLPDLPDDYLTENARVCLSKKMSFLARGFANRRAPEMAVHISARDNSIEWSEFFEKLGMMWRGLRVEHVVDVLKSTHDKVRFEVKVVIKPDREVQLRAFRAIQGHDGILLSEETDVMALNTHSYHLSPLWQPNLANRPRVGTTGYTSEALKGHLDDWSEEGCYLDYLESLQTRLNFHEYRHYITDMTRPYQIAHEENLTVEDEIIRLEDLKFADNAPRPEPLAEAKWGSTLKVWFSAKGIRVDRKYRSELDHFIVQELVSFPWFYCTSCRKHYIDGMIECQFCGSRIAAESDMAHVAEPSKRRLESSRKGRNIDIMSIAPRPGLAMNRHRAERGAREAQDQSLPAAVRSKCVSMRKSAMKRGGQSIADALTNPLDAYNFASRGMGITSLAQLDLFAHLHNPAPGADANERRAFAGTHRADARVSIAYRPGDDRVSLDEAFFVAFQSRLYLIDEISMIIYATQQSPEGRQRPFTILSYDGDLFTPREGTVSEVMAEISRFFQDQLPLSGSRQDPAPRHVDLARSLRIPDGFACLGQTQLNELLRDTRFYQRYLHSNRVEPEWIRPTRASSLGMMRPPPPPTADRRSSAPARRPAEAEGYRPPTAKYGPSMGARERTPSRTTSRGRSPGLSSAMPERPPPQRRASTPRPPPVRRPGSPGEVRTSRRRVDPTGPSMTEGEWLAERRSRVDVEIGKRLNILQELFADLPEHYPFDHDGDLIDPTRTRSSTWTLLDGYYWAMLKARDAHWVSEEEVVNALPAWGNPGGIVVYDYDHVLWYLRGWKHHVMNPHTGVQERRY
ncbi:unnamed protein product [Symbiodinium natans]|uniref:Fe2OG dioxygenase domain-containing protein n=1 Tax=Symbiodinium natans TaxID=878477 RepID=A0A812V2A5_9DINO|nr:unnamed protein product [Symbiodinium natans]